MPNPVGPRANEAVGSSPADHPSPRADVDAAALLEALQPKLPGLTQVTIIRSLGGGYTDAGVFLCDISLETPLEVLNAPGGQVVVKTEALEGGGGHDQVVAHTRFRAELDRFGTEHVPALIASAQTDDLLCAVYLIAGRSLHGLRTLDAVNYRDLVDVSVTAASELTHAQLHAAQAAPNYELTVFQAFEAWLGPSYLTDSRSARLEYAAQIVGSLGSPYLVAQGESLPNPLLFLRDHSLRSHRPGLFIGRLHGDLHLRNLLLSGSRDTNDASYWVIDVSRPEVGPLFYDQAYLEVALLLHGLERPDRNALLRVMSAIEGFRPAAPSSAITFAEQGLVDLVVSYRAAVAAEAARCEPSRPDVWRYGEVLARVAAGLNWARKPIGDESRAAAYLYSAWALRNLLMQFHSDSWAAMLAGPPRTPSPRSVQHEVSEDDRARTAKIWSTLKAAGSSGEALMLFADRRIDHSQLGSLAYLNWNLIIDLDPTSDMHGLLSVLLDQLGARRPVEVFGQTPTAGDLRKSTHWFLANGWSSRFEATPDSLSAWRRTYMPAFRNLVDSVRDTMPSRSATLLVLLGQDREKVDRLVEYVDEAYSGNLRIIEVGQAGPGISLISFANALTEVAPRVSPVGVAPSLPGATGRVTISATDVNRLEVDFELLHSNAIDAPLDPGEDAFWRGRPPTWSDLLAELDIERDLTPLLLGHVRTELANGRSIVVEMQHAPGSGGTTIARRIAWELRHDFPVVYLSQFSDNTAESVAEVYHLTTLPVLVVAEGVVLGEPEREELYSDLRERNARAVMLIVNRSPTPSGDFAVKEPMSADEVARFAAAYSTRARSGRARAAIERLASKPDRRPAQLYTPFFFGLLAFEEDFEGLQPYVSGHLADASFAQRRVALYLALVTRYSQVGIPVQLVRHWLDVVSSSEQEDPLASLGGGLRHLVVQYRDELRLLHPYVAEQVLRDIMGDPVEPERWRAGLAEAAVDLIVQVCAHLGAQNDFARKLLTKLFLRRELIYGRQQARFAELINTIPNREAAHWVLEQLTEQCPDEPHFWNHLGRHHIYEMRADFGQAERYLERAVALSNERDPLHFHTLGMVRRFWLEDDLSSALRGDTRPSIEELLRDITPRYTSALDAFSRARDIGTNEEYSFITPVQVIVHLLGQVVRAGGATSLPELMSLKPGLRTWVAEQIMTAESLLDQHRQLRAGRSVSRHYSGCVADLSELYGDLDALIQQWKAAANDDEMRGAVGRSLARLHFARSGRNWARMDEEELRTTATLYDDVLTTGRWTDSDVRNWFQAFRRIPEYSESKALERFAAIAGVGSSLDANYYLYVLHFLRWYRGDERDQNLVRPYLEECKRQSARRRQWSYEWMGPSSRVCELVHFSELGDWHVESDFYEDHHLLSRMTGVIARIDSARSGRIRIGDGSLLAFFVPGTRFVRSRDVNGLVDFYLGFSYEGLRAWHPDWPGETDTSFGDTQHSGRRSMDMHSAANQPVTPAVPAKTQAAGHSPEAQRTVVVLEQLVTHQGAISLPALGNELIGLVGRPAYEAFLAGRGLKQSIEKLPQFEVVPGSDTSMVRRRKPQAFDSTSG